MKPHYFYSMHCTSFYSAEDKFTPLGRYQVKELSKILQKGGRVQPHFRFFYLWLLNKIVKFIRKHCTITMLSLNLSNNLFFSSVQVQPNLTNHFVISNVRIKVVNSPAMEKHVKFVRKCIFKI